MHKHKLLQETLLSSRDERKQNLKAKEKKPYLCVRRDEGKKPGFKGKYFGSKRQG